MIQFGRWLVTELDNGQWQAVTQDGKSRIEHNNYGDLIETLNRLDY